MSHRLLTREQHEVRERHERAIKSVEQSLAGFCTDLAGMETDDPILRDAIIKLASLVGVLAHLVRQQRQLP